MGMQVSTHLGMYI